MEELLCSKLKERAMSTLLAMILFFLIAIFLSTSILLTCFDVINIVKITDENKSFLIFLSIVLPIGAIGVMLAVMMPYFLDYKSIKNKSYITQTVVVSRFDFYWSGYEPMERIWFPVFVDIHSGKTLKIAVEEKVEAGEQYSIVYLPRTKISILKKSK